MATKSNAQICLACGGPLDVPVQGGRIKCPFCGTVNLIEAQETRKENETICPACGATNPKEAQHCGRCGVKLEFNCPKCGALNSYGAVYCVTCGVDIQGEIKRQQDEIKRQEAEALRKQQEIRQQVEREKRKKRISALVTTGVLLLMLLCVAVVGGGWFYATTMTPAARSTKTAISEAKTATALYLTLFQDDFSNPNSGWDSYTSDNGSADYKNAGYSIQVIKDNWMVWDILPNNFQDDLRIEVEAFKSDGSDNNAFGIICRYQDENNFYFLGASNDGYAVIDKMAGGKFTVISSSDQKWNKVGGIYSGSWTNHLRADCIGDSLTLYVNDTQVATATDSSFQNGQVGLLAGSFSDGSVTVQFDDFHVYRP